METPSPIRITLNIFLRSTIAILWIPLIGVAEEAEYKSLDQSTAIKKFPIKLVEEPEQNPNRFGFAISKYNDQPEGSSFREYKDWEKYQPLLEEAQLMAKIKDYRTSEKIFIKLLNSELEKELIQLVLLEMAEMYNREGTYSKSATTFERFIELYPTDHKLPKIYIKLGTIYREMGAFKLAVSRFYNVLNASLNIPGEEIESYKLITHRAQLEIAETYFLMGDYNSSSKFFSRLQLLNLQEDVRMEIRFKYAYARYMLGEYDSTIAILHNYSRDFPQSHLLPESHFLLANSYSRLGLNEKAVEQVLNLLSEVKTHSQYGDETWHYWKKKTGNQLANEFYENGDFLSALKIYQSMAQLSHNPEWQWPVIYQIGLCYERLRMHPNAKEAYFMLIEETEWKNEKYVITENLESLKNLAQWRYNHLQWASNIDNRLKLLLTSEKQLIIESNDDA